MLSRKIVLSGFLCFHGSIGLASEAAVNTFKIKKANVNGIVGLSYAENDSVKATSGQQSLRLRYDVPDHYNLTNEKNSDTYPRIQGLSPMGHIGSPNLPTGGTLVAVPKGYSLSARLVDHEIGEIQNVDVSPFSREYRCDCNIKTAAYRNQTYLQNTSFPEHVWSVSSVGTFGDVELYRVGFYPFQYNPVTRNLAKAKTIEVEVLLTPTRTQELHPISQDHYRQLAHWTVNGKTILSQTNAASPGRLLIVAPQAWLPLMTEFMAAKQAQGYTVDTATSGTFGTADQLSATIKSYYMTHKPATVNVLLVGDGSKIPYHRRSTSSGSAVSDYVYSAVDGNDIIPDLYIGRIVAATTDEVQTQLAKIVKNDNKAAAPGSWYTEATTIASNEGSNPSDKEYAMQIATALTGGTFTKVDGFYQGEGTATPTNITASVNAGRSWLAYFGHGSGTSWGSTNGSFSNATIATLTNVDKWPVIIDVACMNGSFVDVSTSFGKKWLTHRYNNNPSGAVAYYGGTVNISWHPPAIMSVGIAQKYVADKLDRVGPSLLAGQMHLVAQNGTGEDVLDNFEWYVLFGDPTQMWRTSAQ